MTAPHQIALFAEPVREWVPFGTVECGECEGTTQVCVRAEAQKPYRKWWRKCDACTDGRVPVVPSWPCPTCWNSGGMVPSNRHDTDRPLPCPTCGGSGVVHFGELTVGVAAHKRAQRAGDHVHAEVTVPAALTEIITVEAYPVAEDYEQVCSAYEGPAAVEVTPSGRVLFFAAWDSATEDEGTDITDEFPVPPNPGEWVGWVTARQALSDPITGWPCPPRPCIDCLVARIARKCTHRVPVDAEIPLPQQVGWYQADDVLVAEIERRKP